MDTIFIVKKMQEEYQKKEKKLCMCFADIKKTFIVFQERRVYQK